MPVFDVSFLNKKMFCINEGKPDLETGCVACGENAKITFETCRQSYYLKQQNEILKQGVQQQSTISTISTTNNDQKVKELESDNIGLQKIIEQQNQQIEELIVNSKQSDQRIENANLLNIVLIAGFLIFTLSYLVVKFVKCKKLKSHRT